MSTGNQAGAPNNMAQGSFPYNGSGVVGIAKGLDLNKGLVVITSNMMVRPLFYQETIIYATTTW